VFHIAAPFYTKELRQLVKQLKAEGRLNERPLWELDKQFSYKLCVLMAIPFIVFYFSPEEYPVGIMFLLGAILIPVFVVRDIIKYLILPCTYKNSAKAVILTVPRFNPWRLDIARKYLSFKYMFLDDSGCDIVSNKRYKLEGFWKGFCGDQDFYKGQIIDFVVNQRVPRKSFPLTDAVMKIWSLNKDNLGGR
jgi:hypothetical protein